MVGLTAERMEPEEEPRASISLTTFMDSASATSPKTTCLPSSHEVTTVVMKNWEPLLERRHGDLVWFCVGHLKFYTQDLRVRASVGHGQETRAGVLVDEVLIGELLAVDRAATGTLFR